MAHQVETMAYTNQVPWHGLGHYVAKAPDVDGMLKAAQLNWSVEKQPMFLGDEERTEVPGKSALVRSSDGKVLDVVGSQYKPTQNTEAFEFFREFVDAGGATMETAGSLRGGQFVWGLANLNASFTMAGGDEVKGYLLVASPHKQGKSLLVRFTTVRVVCNNTLTLALGEGGTEFRMSHRRSFDEVTRTEAKDALGIAREQMGTFERNARKLKRMKMTQREVIEVLAPIYQEKAPVGNIADDFEANGSIRMKRLVDVLSNAPGAQPDNAWGVLNAVTYYSDHLASRTNDKRLTNAWFGKTANDKERVLEALLLRAEA